jgi:Holliday junction resolvase
MQKQTDAQPLEKVIVNKIMAAIRGMGIGFVVKTHGSIFQAAGLPDIVTIAPGGRFLGIEVKRSEKQKPTLLQKAVINCINRCGGYAIVVWTVDQALDAMTAASTGMDAPVLT